MTTSLLFVLGGVALVVVTMRLLEPRMIYFPGPQPVVTPADAGLDFEDVSFPSADGETLRGWWVPAPGVEGPVLLFFHGNAGTREDRLDLLRGMHAAGLPVFMFDYRGYGGSTGRPSEPGLYLDGEAAYDWLRGRVGRRPIVFHGHSLGAAVAARTALSRPAAGIILESPFTSVPDMANRAVPIPGVRYVVKARFDNREALRQYQGPLLIIHGVRDEVVPFRMGQALFDGAASLQKDFHAIPGAQHNDTYLSGGREYWKRIAEFAAGVTAGGN